MPRGNLDYIPLPDPEPVLLEPVPLVPPVPPALPVPELPLEVPLPDPGEFIPPLLVPLVSPVAPEPEVSVEVPGFTPEPLTPLLSDVPPVAPVPPVELEVLSRVHPADASRVTANKENKILFFMIQPLSGLAPLASALVFGVSFPFLFFIGFVLGALLFLVFVFGHGVSFFRRGPMPRAD